jgi:hypothetical protein
MSAVTLASLYKILSELETRLSKVESEVVVLRAENAALKSGSSLPVVEAVKEEKKKGNNPTGPSAYNKQVKEYVLAHPDVPYETAQIEVSISNWMTRDGLTRAEAEAKIAELKAKRSKKSKKAVEETVINTLPDEIIIPQPLSLFSPSTQVMEKLQATKKVIDGQTYYVDEQNLTYVIPNGVVDDFVVVGKFNEDKNTVKLNKSGKKYFGIVDTNE